MTTRVSAGRSAGSFALRGCIPSRTPRPKSSSRTRNSPLFDCLVLDVHLGNMSGIELGMQLAAEGRTAPFICITAHEDPGTRAQAEAAGCAAFFLKTDSGAAVLDAIRRVAR